VTYGSPNFKKEKKIIWANDMLSISQGKEEEEETNTWR
jgi:hypothetical protein